MEVRVESEVGTLVWVRRKNGSWWPGKILGCEELSAPRSGSTPVKLLGREDASIDWYNLKKSKRVKPFRCGEFDHCIQRAHAMCPKKREKYASREDAILQALEVEKQLLHNKYPTPVPLNCTPGDVSQLSKEPGPNNQVNRRSTRVTHVPARLMEYDNDLSPQDTIQRKRPHLDDHNQPTPKLPNPMPLQLLLAGMAAAASGDSFDHTPDHLLSEKTKPSPEDEDEEEDSEADSSGTESLGSDTYDATLSAESIGRGIDADTGNKQLVDRLQKELLNQKQRNQQMETELVAMKRERDFALSKLKEMRQLKQQKGECKKEHEVKYAGN